MDDNRIEIVAGLDVGKTKITIKDELEGQVKPYLDSEQALKVKCFLDDTSFDAIQEKLQDIKLNVAGVTIDDSVFVAEVARTVDKVKDNLKPTAKVDLSVDSSAAENLIDKLSELNVYGVNTEKLQKQFEDLKVSIQSITPVFTTLKEGGEQVLSSLVIKGTDANKNAVTFTQNWDAASQKFTKSTVKITENLGKVEKAQIKVQKETEASQKVYNEYLKLEGRFEQYYAKYGEDDSLASKFDDALDKLADFDNTAPLEKQRESLIKIDNVLKLIQIDIDKIKASSNNVSKVSDSIYPEIAYKKGDTTGTLNAAKETLNAFFKDKSIDGTADRVKRAVEDTTGALQTFYVQVEKGDKSVETLTYSLNAQGTAYEYLGKTIREADNSTDFRRMGINVQKTIQTENIEKFAAQVEKSGIKSAELNKRISILRESISKVDDSNSMNAFLDDLDIAKAQFQALNAVAKRDSFAVTLDNKIKKLTADMNAFAVANYRAIDSSKQMSDGTTFKQKWQDLLQQLSKGSNLSADEVKHLREEFAIFGKESEAAGLKGASAFDKFKKSFTVFSSYVTANMVFGFVKRQLQQLAQEVINVDTSMTELRKVTEATDEEFEAFALSAAKTGKQLGASISEVIDATSEFARAGFNLPDAEELGRIATLYKNVGDGIDINEASESIISIVKAFNVEAENSIEIIDKINEVSNRAAIDSGGLGFALQRVASAMVSANNTLDETIALTASANEVVQNPEMVSQGWRTVALRIRGAKTELEEMGDDTEGMVESTAKLRDLIKGISGVDIMLDANTFKSTYQIIDELGRVWKQLSDIDQAALLEAIAGKRQSNIVASTLNNYERLEEILRISKESAGSAMKEQKEYAKSIQYSIDRARAAYQELAQTFIDKGVLKDLIDTGAALLTVASGIVKLAKALEPFIKLTNQLVFGNSGGLRKVIDDLSNFSGAIFGDESYLDELSERVRVLSKDSELLAEDYISVNDAIQQYKTIVESGVDVDDQLLSLQTRLIASFGDEAEAIDIVNGKYKDTIKNIQELSEKEYKKWFAENADVIAEAKKLSQLDVGWIQTKDRYYDVTDYSTHKDFYNKGLVTDQTVSNIYKIKDVSEDIEEIWQQIDGIEFLDGVITNDIIFSGTVEDAKNQLEQLIFIYGNMDNYNGETLAKLQTRYNEISNILEKINTYTKQINSISESNNKTFVFDLSEKEIIQDYIDIQNEIESKSIDISKTVFGNIDANQRQLLEWTEDTAKQYSDELKSWELEAEDVVGTISTILGSWDTYDGVDIAFTPILQTEDGAVLLDANTVNEYIWGLIDTAGEGWTNEQLLRLDTEGLEFDGVVIKNLLADIGDAAKETSEQMHFIGENGALSQSEKAVQSIADSLGLTIDELISAFLKSEPVVEETTNSIVNDLKSIGSENDNLRKEWFENLSEMQKGSLKTIESMKAALKSIADGEYLTGEEFWALAEFDTDNILNGVQLIGDKFNVTEEQLIRLKDIYIKKQTDIIKAENTDLITKKAQTDELIKQAELQIQALGRRGLSNSSYRTEYEETRNALKEAKQNSKDYGETIYRNTLLIRQLNGSLGDTVDLTEKAKDLQTQADNYSKAMTTAVQNVIDGLSNEKEQLEDEKELLNEQLDILNERKDAIEETIEQYKTTANLIKDIVKDEINDLKEKQKAEEDAIQKQIDNLKEQQDQEKEKNDLIEKQLTLRQKLAELDKAKSTKVRTYSAERGWHYDVDKEAVANAQTAVDEAQKSYDEAVESYSYAQKSYDEALSELEEYKNNLAEIEQEIAESNIDITQTVFGNIDTNSRQLLEWSNENLQKYADAIQSWELEYDDLAGSISTVLGMSSEYDGIEIAFSPLLQTENGAVLLTSDSVDEYIWGLIEKAGEGWTNEKLFQLDKIGLDVNGKNIKNLLADIGDTAIQTGMAMHYVGKNGALAIAQKELETANDNVLLFEDVLKKSNNGYKSQIKALEKEKELISDNYDEQIKGYEDYYEQWEEITNEQTTAEQEQLAEQILGSEWREAIKRKDTNIINKFASDFRSYNAQLDSLVKGEIASLNKSIEAKQNEIDAKNKQIESWQKYKTEVSDSIDKISGKYDDYLELLGKINLTENSTYEERERALREFLPKYEALIDEIKGYQDKIGKVTISIDVDDTEARRKLLEFYSDANTYKAIAEMERALADAPQAMRLWFDQYKEMLGFSKGGTADFTGAAILHGTKRKAETIFTSGQSKELYDMVKSGSFVNQVADKAYAGLSTAISKMSNSTDNSSRVININGLTIKTDNPAQFHEQFIHEIGKYWNVKLSEARVRR